MANPLVIVESPAKAKTIAGFLASANGADGTQVAAAPDLGSATVDASVGHVRDLPRNAADVPEAEKRQWEILGIDVENDFKPLYVVSKDKRDVIKKLKAELKNASELYLATDEDREGEAIAWHLLEVLNPPASMPVKRMVFHEITPQAIQAGHRQPPRHRPAPGRRPGGSPPARPDLWLRPAGVGGHAEGGARQQVGRVQSVGTRLVVERERERMRFVSASYWDLDGEFATLASGADGSVRTFSATLVALDGERLASGQGLRRGRPGSRRCGRARPGPGRGGGCRAGRRLVRGPLGGAPALPASALAAVHHLDLPAGGRAQAPPLVLDGHAGGPEPLRGGLHHLHADRLDHLVRHRAVGGAGRDRRALRPPVPARRAAALRQEGQERPGGPRGHPAGG